MKAERFPIDKIERNPKEYKAISRLGDRYRLLATNAYCANKQQNRYAVSVNHKEARFEIQTSLPCYHDKKPLDNRKCGAIL